MTGKIIVERIKVNIKGQVSYLTVEELKNLRDAINEVIGELAVPFYMYHPEPPVPENPPYVEPDGDKWTFKPSYTVSWSSPSNLGVDVNITLGIS